MSAFGGMPEAAVLVAPWAVLLALALSRSGPDRSKLSLALAADRVLVGDDVEVYTTVTEAAGSVRVRVQPTPGFWPQDPEDESRRSAEIHDVLVADRAAVALRLPATQWGLHDVGRVEVTVTEPFGLFRWDGELNRPMAVRVHPHPTELRSLLKPWLVRRVTGAHVSKAIGRGLEYADIRPFTSGDSLRDINWRASARSSELWVSQRHPDQATEVILLLDSFVESGHDVHTVVGLAIEASIALAESHLAATDRVGLVELGGLVRWVTPSTGQLQLQRLVDALLSTGLYSHVAERNLQVIMSRKLPPRSFVVALTPLLDDRFIDALFMLSGQGHDVAVVECDSAADGATERVGEGSWQLARRLWQADRQIVRDRLAQHGIAAAEWHPGTHLDMTLRELSRRRQRTVRTRHR